MALIPPSNPKKPLVSADINARADGISQVGSQDIFSGL